MISHAISKGITFCSLNPYALSEYRKDITAPSHSLRVKLIETQDFHVQVRLAHAHQFLPLHSIFPTSPSPNSSVLIQQHYTMPSIEV